MTDDLTYSDDTVRIGADSLTLPRYFFPTGRAKVIPLGDIVAAEVRPTNWWMRWRLWGSSKPTNWLPLDVGRPKKPQAVVLDLGGRISPTFTPDDPEAVVALLSRA